MAQGNSQLRHRYRVFDLRPCRAGRTDDWRQRQPAFKRVLWRGTGAARRRGSHGGPSQRERQRAAFVLQRQQEHQHLRPWSRVGTGEGLSPARQLSTRDSPREHRRVVPGSRQQPLRYEFRPVRRRDEVLGGAVRAYRRDYELRQHQANTWTLGFVFNPTRNLTGTIDWWSIKIDDAINAPPPASVLNQCLNNGLLCNLIHRDSQQTLWLFTSGGIDAFTDNLGGYKTTGVDLALNWTQRIGEMGGVGLHFLGSYMNK
ncbi:MAG: TonB-dependent receptor, partial [Betaproteobacteria bacterium]